MRRTPAGMEIDEMKRIVVDSSASLYQLDGIDFASVPLKIVTDEREYLDDGTLDAVEMATALRTYKGKTSTSCPSIGDWLEAYEGADEIYAITITGTLSGSCNAAQLAAEEYQALFPSLFICKFIYINNTFSTTYGSLRHLYTSSRVDRKSTRLNSSHNVASRMPSSA